MGKKFDIGLENKKKYITKNIILEYLECILDYEKQGYSARSIWESLKNQGIIKTSYVHFCKNLKEIKEEKRIINE